jgi:hypothetical protein
VAASRSRQPIGLSSRPFRIEAVAAHLHRQDQLGGEAAQQALQRVDGRFPAPRLEGEEVHLVAEEDPE